MRRVVPLLAALILLLGAGLVQGVWTQRWQKSAALEAAVARVKALPTEFGDWRSEEQPVPANELALAGAEAAWVRRFTSPQQPKGILVMLLCGRTNAMCAHQPETCYAGAGYDIAAAPLFYTVRASKGCAPRRVLDRQLCEARPSRSSPAADLLVLAGGWQVAGTLLAALVLCR